MAQPLNTSSNLEEEMTSSALGIKNPLLPPPSLGQSFLSPKFLSPSTQSLTTINPLGTSYQDTLGESSHRDSFPNLPSSPSDRTFSSDQAIQRNATTSDPKPELVSIPTETTTEEAIASAPTLQLPIDETTATEKPVVQAFRETGNNQQNQASITELAQPSLVSLSAENEKAIAPSANPESEGNSTTAEQPVSENNQINQAAITSELPIESTTEQPSVQAVRETENNQLNSAVETKSPEHKLETMSSEKMEGAIAPSTTTPELPVESTTEQPSVQTFRETENNQPNPTVETKSSESGLVSMQGEEMEKAIAPSVATSESPIQSNTTTEQPSVQAFRETENNQPAVETKLSESSLGSMQSEEMEKAIAPSVATSELPVESTTEQPSVQAFRETVETKSSESSLGSMQSEEMEKTIAPSVATPELPIENTTEQPSVQAFKETENNQSMQGKEVEKAIAPSVATPESPIESTTEQPSVQAFKETENNPLMQGEEMEEAIAPSTATSELPIESTTEQPSVQTFRETENNQQNPVVETKSSESGLVSRQNEEMEKAIAPSVATPELPVESTTEQPSVQAFKETENNQLNPLVETKSAESSLVSRQGEEVETKSPEQSLVSRQNEEVERAIAPSVATPELPVESTTEQPSVQAFRETENNQLNPLVETKSAESSLVSRQGEEMEEAIAPSTATSESPIESTTEQPSVQAFKETENNQPVVETKSSESSLVLMEGEEMEEAIAPSVATPESPIESTTEQPSVQAFKETDNNRLMQGEEMEEAIAPSTATSESSIESTTEQLSVQAFRETENNQPNPTVGTKSSESGLVLRQGEEIEEAIAPSVATPELPVESTTEQPSVQAFRETENNRLMQGEEMKEAIAPSVATPESPVESTTEQPSIQAFRENENNLLNSEVEIKSPESSLGLMQGKEIEKAIAPLTTTPELPIESTTEQPSVQTFRETENNQQNPVVETKSSESGLVSRQNEEMEKAILPSTATSELPIESTTEQPSVQAFKETENNPLMQGEEMKEAIAPSTATSESSIESTTEQLSVQAFRETENNQPNPTVGTKSSESGLVLRQGEEIEEAIAPSVATPELPVESTTEQPSVQAFRETENNRLMQGEEMKEAIAPSVATPESPVESTTEQPSIQAFRENENNLLNSEVEIKSPESSLGLMQGKEIEKAIAPLTTTPELPIESTTEQPSVQTFRETENNQQNPVVETKSSESGLVSRQNEEMEKAILPSTATSELPIESTTEQPSVQAFKETENNPLMQGEEMKEAIAPSVATPESTAENVTSANYPIVQAFSEAESVRENISTINPSIIQPSSDTEELSFFPTVIQNLGASKPLGVSRALAQESDFLKPALTSNSLKRNTNIQRMAEPSNDSYDVEKLAIASLPSVQARPINTDAYSRETNTSNNITIQRFASDAANSIPAKPQNAAAMNGSVMETPTSWSSIEELFSESTNSRSDRIVVQPYVEDDREDEFSPLNLGNSESVKDNFTAEQQNQSSSSTTIQANSNSSDSISGYSGENTLQMASPITTEQSHTGEISSSGNERSQKEDSHNLEILARDIYGLIRQRLGIERERGGF